MNKKEVPKKVVSIVAPSSGYKIAEYKSGLKYLKNLKDLDLEISSEPNLKNKADYLSAPDNLREKELSKSLFSKNIDFVWAARGGYGLTRLLPMLRQKKVGIKPTVIGYSDTCVLFSYLFKVHGKKSIHGPSVTELGDLRKLEEKYLLELMSVNYEKSLSYDGLDVLDNKNKKSEISKKRLFAFNLTMLTTLIGTPWLVDFKDSILVLEEVGEKPYQMDRMLTQIMSSKILAGVRCVILGHMTTCGSAKSKIYDLFVERLSSLKIPVLGGLKSGHEAPNLGISFGGMHSIDIKSKSAVLKLEDRVF